VFKSPPFVEPLLNPRPPSFQTQTHDPQFSKQIDAADSRDQEVSESAPSDPIGHLNWET